MLPSLPISNSTKSAGVHTECSCHGSQLRPGGQLLPGLPHYLVGQFGVGVRGAGLMGRFIGWAYTVTRSPLSHHVPRVVFEAPEKEMGRIDAQRRIAAVQDIHSVGNGAIGHFIGNSVRQFLVFAVARIKHSVALIVFVGLPKPAFRVRAARDLFGKSFFQRAGVISHA